MRTHFAFKIIFGIQSFSFRNELNVYGRWWMWAKQGTQYGSSFRLPSIRPTLQRHTYRSKWARVYSCVVRCGSRIVNKFHRTSILRIAIPHPSDRATHPPRPKGFLSFHQRKASDGPNRSHTTIIIIWHRKKPGPHIFEYTPGESEGPTHGRTRRRISRSFLIRNNQIEWHKQI